MEEQKRYTYSKEEKLKSKKLIAELFASGKSFSKYPLRAVVLKSELPFEGVKAQVGVSVSKRNFKHAVDRNRIKRLLREAYRLEKHDLLDHIDESLAIMILYVTKDKLSQEEVRIKMKKLLAKIVSNHK